MEKQMNEELLVVCVYHYKPVSYEYQVKELYRLWGIEYVPEPGLTVQDLEKMGVEVVFEPIREKYCTTIDLYDNSNEL